MIVEHISKQTGLIFYTNDENNIETVTGVKLNAKIHFTNGDEQDIADNEPSIKFNCKNIGLLLANISGYIKEGINTVYCSNTDHTFILNVNKDYIEVNGFYWGMSNNNNTEQYNGMLTAKYGG